MAKGKRQTIKWPSEKKTNNRRAKRKRQTITWSNEKRQTIKWQNENNRQ